MTRIVICWSHVHIQPQHFFVKSLSLSLCRRNVQYTKGVRLMLGNLRKLPTQQSFSIAQRNFTLWGVCLSRLGDGGVSSST